jgi:acyl carrier protein
VTSQAEAQERIHRIFRERVAVEVPSADTDLFASGLVDSLAFVELLVGIEEELGTRIALDELDLEDLRSISKIARLVTSRNGDGRGGP